MQITSNKTENNHKKIKADVVINFLNKDITLIWIMLMLSVFFVYLTLNIKQQENIRSYFENYIRYSWVDDLKQKLKVLGVFMVVLKLKLDILKLMIETKKYVFSYGSFETRHLGFKWP